MKLLFLVLAVLFFTACGSSGENGDTNPPASPHLKDASKIPPAVPKID